MPGFACRPAATGACLAAWIAVTGAVACGGEPGTAEHASEAPRADADHAGDLHAVGDAHGDAPLEIGEEAQRSTGMRIVAAEHRELPVPMEVTGFVTPDTTRLMRVRALAEGVISRVDVKLGDRVRAGQPLIEYDNVALGDHIAEYRAAVAARRQAEADLEVRRRSFERAEQLIAVEAIAQQTVELRRSELDQAEAGVLSAQAEVTRIEERIHRFGWSDADLSEVAPRDGAAGELQAAAERHREASLNVLRAPFDGVVTEYSVAVGDLVGPDRDLLTITDISTVWVLADVYESDLGRLPPAAEVTIRTDAYPDRVFSGRITYVSDTIEAQTRAAHVRCVVANPDDALKLGMFVGVTIPTNERVAALAAPVAAVQQIDGQPVVFVQTGRATFERRDVTLGSTAGGVVEVLSGLAAGESIVAEGSFYLKTALLNDRIGHAH
ncbi:MAG: efflux RND transporter periplasmic adaptor subunit [Acidobacteria bacterium]|nr:efflux RND transporter periplasmic adaptor subunit [Acidobacteriota bacterium]